MKHSASTLFLADLHSGKFTKVQMRERVKGGEYPELRLDWAGEWVKLAGIG